MGKSIYTQIEEGRVEIVDGDNKYTTAVPKILELDIEAMGSAKGIMENLTEEELVLFVHAGIREILIGFRAEYRANEKREEGGRKSAEELLAWRPKRLTKPGVRKSVSEAAALEAIAKTHGISVEALKQLLAAQGEK